MTHETRAAPTADARMRQALESTKSAFHDRLGSNDLGFLDRVYRQGLSVYVDRLNAIGFSRHQSVLDAGCGFGQWSLALTQLNDAVSACDVSTLRIELLSQMATVLNATNLTARVARLNALPYPDNHFDAAFCYSVIFLTPWRQSLAELARVLKPGGKLYVNANGVGWYLHLWHSEHNKTDDYDPRGIAARAFTDTLRYDREDLFEDGMNLIIDPKHLRDIAEGCQLQWQHQAGEGRLHVDPSAPAPKPFFQAEYRGHLGVYELLGVKSASAPAVSIRSESR